MIPIVVCGQNRVTAKKTLDKIAKKLDTSKYTVTKIQADAIDSAAPILAALESPPLLGGKTAVIIMYLSENTPSKTKSILQTIKNTLTKLPTKTPVVFFEPYEKSHVATKAKKWMWKVIEHAPAQKRELNNVLLKKLRSKGIRIDSNYAYKLTNRLGENDLRHTTETEKIAALVDTINEASWPTITQIVPETSEAKIWQVIDGLFEQNAEKVKKELKGLLASGNEAIGILHLFYQQFRKLLLFKLYSESGQATNLARDVGIPPFAVSRFSAASGRYPEDTLVHLLGFLVDQESAIKTGQADAETSVTLFAAKSLAIKA